MSTFLIQFLTGLASAASLFMVAAGLSIIFGVSRIVNFAHGSFYMLGAYLAYSLGQRFGGSGLGFWSAVILAALLVVALLVVAAAAPVGPVGLAALVVAPVPVPVRRLGLVR